MALYLFSIYLFKRGSKQLSGRDGRIVMGGADHLTTPISHPGVRGNADIIESRTAAPCLAASSRKPITDEHLHLIISTNIESSEYTGQITKNKTKKKNFLIKIRKEFVQIQSEKICYCFFFFCFYLFIYYYFLFHSAGTLGGLEARRMIGV